jgi:anthranilate synthase/aminodeoxychorismate synthase-like glutamine amidotransferase
MTRLLVIDNYDSFTYNLVQYAAEAGAEPVVYRNDALTAAAALALEPDAILVSPGPCTPREAGVSVPLILAAAGRVPLLGVCLGHQAIAQAFGGVVARADAPMHGKATAVEHRGTDLFAGLPSPLVVMRYHSLTVRPEGFPEALEVTAWSAGRPTGPEIMALRHRRHAIFGVQFHPESIGTEGGRALLANFLAIASNERAGAVS